MVGFDIEWVEYISVKNEWDKDFMLDEIAPINRRRLSQCAKSVFSLTNAKNINTPVVFSSNYGEINRCFELLKSLKFEISPTSFSLSVLNAIPALLSIHTKNQSEIEAISSNASLEYAILNACTKQKALIISHFEGVDKEYFKHLPFSVTIAMMIKKSDKYTLSFSPTSGKICKDVSEINFLKNYKKDSWEFDDGTLLWKWKRRV